MPTPRCIAIEHADDRRCHRRAIKRGRFVLCARCASNGYLMMLIEDRISALGLYQSMALRQWETRAQYNWIRWGGSRVA